MTITLVFVSGFKTACVLYGHFGAEVVVFHHPVLVGWLLNVPEIC